MNRKLNKPVVDGAKMMEDEFQYNNDVGKFNESRKYFFSVVLLSITPLSTPVGIQKISLSYLRFYFSIRFIHMFPINYLCVNTDLCARGLQ